MALSDMPPEMYGAELVPFGGDAPRRRWQEWVSWAVVDSIASSCGLVVQVMRVDANRKDVLVETWGPLDGRQRTVGLQLKSTINPNFVEDRRFVTFDLERDAYDDLTAEATVPKFLVLVAVSGPPHAVGRSDQDAVVLRAAAWWGEVTDPSNGLAHQRVRLSTDQRFDGAALEQMLRNA